MKEIDITYGEYASKWGLTDFYDESAEKLKSALESGEDFDTGWFGCKKEINYAKYVKCGNDFEISVSAHIDDMYESDDLIYDALWEVAKSEEELPDDIIDSIRECAIWDGIEDYSELSETIPVADATFEKVVEITEKLESQAMEHNHEMFKLLCEIVKNHLNYMEESKNG